MCRARGEVRHSPLRLSSSEDFVVSHHHACSSGMYSSAIINQQYKVLIPPLSNFLSHQFPGYYDTLTRTSSIIYHRCQQKGKDSLSLSSSITIHPTSYTINQYCSLHPLSPFKIFSLFSSISHHNIQVTHASLHYSSSGCTSLVTSHARYSPSPHPFPSHPSSPLPIPPYSPHPSLPTHWCCSKGWMNVKTCRGPFVFFTHLVWSLKQIHYKT